MVFTGLLGVILGGVIFNFNLNSFLHKRIEGKTLLTIMEQSIQTQQLLEDYVSINERPKRSKVSKCSKYTPEEKAGRARISTMKYYYSNLEKNENENDCMLKVKGRFEKSKMKISLFNKLFVVRLSMFESPF